MVIRPVILCGGSGTRLWPLSTPERPKQFLSLTAPKSMISLTASRLQAGSHRNLNTTNTLIVGSKRHEALLRSQLPDADLILEPFGRNSAPAVAAACLVSDPDDLLLILPADHDIKAPAAFLDAVEVAQNAASQGAIVTFGIKPTHPATGYGYIRSTSDNNLTRTVLSFVEKPDQATAESYLKDGQFLWNAGIFLFKVSTMITAFETYAPSVLKRVRSALSPASDNMRTLDPTQFAKVKNISLDYAIMEHETNIKVVPVDMGWNDVGDYQALWDMFAETTTSNVTFGPTITENSKGLFVRSEGPAVCASGLDDYVIVAKPDIVMITPRGDPLAVKSLGAAHQAQARGLSLNPSTATRAKAMLWDAFEAWAELAWDNTNGGFVECLDLSGLPAVDAPRRVRVQARQIYSFARAIKLDWPSKKLARAHVEQGLEHLSTTCRHKDGGWVHTLTSQGDVIDPTRDLYDHAFVMLAGAAAYAATGSEPALQMAKRALSFIDNHLKDDQRGGYYDSTSNRDIRRANPHMHLLEAFLELYAATNDQDYLGRASQIVTLFETRFFCAQENTLCEFFNPDWTPVKGDNGRAFEPGHHYEWATLLAIHDKITGRDTASWRRRLILQADRYGIDAVSGLAHNSVLPDGTPINDRRRIWQQFEMFRAKLWHPGTGAPGDCDRIFEAISMTYFSSMPKGTWLDETDANGRPISTAIPASILYHLVTNLSAAFPVS